MWLSDEQEFWSVLEDESAPLQPLGLQQVFFISTTLSLVVLPEYNRVLAQFHFTFSPYHLFACFPDFHTIWDIVWELLQLCLI